MHGERAHVGQLAFVHPAAHQAWIHPVEPENHELLMEPLRRPPGAAGVRQPKADRAHDEEGALHSTWGSADYISEVRAEVPAGQRAGALEYDRGVPGPGRVLAVDVGER